MKHVFTLVGGHISPILVACEKIGINVVDTRHEVCMKQFSLLWLLPNMVLCKHEVCMMKQFSVFWLLYQTWFNVKRRYV